MFSFKRDSIANSLFWNVLKTAYFGTKKRVKNLFFCKFKVAKRVISEPKFKVAHTKIGHFLVHFNLQPL